MHMLLAVARRAKGGVEAERTERARQKEAAAAKDRRNFEWLQQLRREGFRKVRKVPVRSTDACPGPACCSTPFLRPCIPIWPPFLTRHACFADLAVLVCTSLLRAAPRHAGPARR